VVTGAGQGLGKAIAIALAQSGARVVVNNRSPHSKGGTSEETARIIEAMGGLALPVYGDVSNLGFCRELIQAAVDNWGGIDILVNNAGINRDRMVWNMSEEEWDDVIAVVMKGTFGCTKYAAAHMRAKKGGRIINMTSQAGIEGNAGQPNYSAAKAGIIGFTMSCAIALKKYGITVNAISPQAATRMWRKVGPERAREMGVIRGLVTRREAACIPDEDVVDKIFGSPEDVAPLVVYLASKEGGAVTGKVLFSSGGRIILYGPPARTVLFKGGRWTHKELQCVLPGLLEHSA